MKSGLQCKAYLNTGTNAVPVWVLIARARDISIDPTKEGVEATCREFTWKKSLPGFKALAASFDYLKKNGADTVFASIQTAFLNDVATEFAFMDGAIATATSRGWRAFFLVAALKEGQQLTNAVTYSVTLEHTYAEEVAGTVIDPSIHVAT